MAMIKRKQEWVEPMWLASKQQWIDRSQLRRHIARRPINQKLNQKPAANSSFAAVLRLSLP